MPVTAIIQARMGSSRLPGKVLEPILGRPMLARMIERLAWSREIERLVIATTANPKDEAVARLARDVGLACFRGSEEDVLDRYYQAALAFEADPVVRLTADCPLIDPEVSDRVIRCFLDLWPEIDAVSLSGPFPDGLDTQVFSLAALKRAWREAVLPSEREHVGPYLRKHPEIFRLAEVRWEQDHAQVRLSVDEPQDLSLVRAIYEALYEEGSIFLTSDVLRFLEAHPHLKRLNTHIKRNEGYQKSLAADEVWLKRRSRGQR